jgi:signal transduction histidine kinase/DNA-binding response OmpR family regulator
MGRILTRGENPLTRSVARLPAPIHRKLLIAFTAIVVLLVVIGALGLRALGQSNDRMEALGVVQQREAAYRALQIRNTELRPVRGQLSSDFAAYIGGDSSLAAAAQPGSVLSDDEIVAVLSQLRPAYDADSLGFTPPGGDRRVLLSIQADYDRFASVMTRVVDLRRAGRTAESQQLQAAEAEPIAYNLEVLIDQLVNRTQNQSVELLDQNRRAYQASRRAFTGFALGGVALALLLGLAISWSIVGPVQQMKTRLAEIAAGDFSGRVDVVNRDELGVLAADLNRMNDELGRLYHDLETASRHKSEFLASMSHELRTPLNAIIGFSEVLGEEMFGPLNERQADYLNDILSSGRHLLSLINDILDLSKVEAGKMELELSTFPLAAVLEGGLTMVRERAVGHGIALGLDVAPDVGDVTADERKVKQVVFNLLSNAVKFTPDGGRIDMAARCVGDEVEVAVRDTGVGIAPEDQERVFEEFQQAGQREGSGLGLALTRSFVELHGGRIRLDSEPGMGSTFTFTLPVGAPAPSERLGVDPASAGATMVVIEDDERSAELLRIYLEDGGFSVTLAGDGEAGIEAARRLRPAAIVLDLFLPGLSGWDVITRVKADPALADTPVVIVSMVDERGKGYALGAAGYLVKPVSRDDLLGALRPLIATGSVDGERVKVLAVDDDPLALELVDTVLSAEGYTVLRAQNGEEGISVARRELPALVILDLLMPGTDGFEVVEQLRADRRTADIPIVVLTAKAIGAADRARLNSRIAHLAEKGSFSRAEFVELVRRSCRAPVG